MRFSFLAIWIGLTIGNVLYQVFASHNWMQATERSFFQGGAIFACWLASTR